MLKPVTVENALNMTNRLFIDVRSPSEFAEATIPGAINIPILDDYERAKVGTVYRKDSKEDATTVGLDFVASKLTGIYERIKYYSDIYDSIIIFCWRGGMRSKSVCNFLNMMSISNTYQLAGGYKAYRKHVVDFIDHSIEKYKFIMIHGLTGVGKTHILELLHQYGQPVLDLERLAQNSGSVFGDIVFEGSPPTQKNFEAFIFDNLSKLCNNYVFVESESKRIGGVHVPESLYTRMLSGAHVLIETSLQNRVDIILSDYVNQLAHKNEKIIAAIQNLNKRLGNDVVADLVHRVKAKEYTYVIEYLIEYYYDPLYKYSIEKYRPYDLTIEYENIEEVVPKLEHFVTYI
ncbi:tRNA 2-selenouridine synthase [Anaerosolibacter carboniphilus]|uniref:tRNA 2-selenouridine synthase n=1 Tax=Anaerosolibacter carboniphilus TaxID=1417629 RepID=A0A841L2F1_9FIRM|nr:tRNA 2-selenouridine(34) synthase MnmH [Anaerosolibacter carboniphilus]MBB6216535.1 tRNA 2-selenouridine synthase [Anaerosolibacter carboniphilus]